MKRFSRAIICAGLLACMAAIPVVTEAQDSLPHDNGLTTYHTAPRYRESESHPLRIVGYVLHPIGWLAREVIFRPISYFASSTETTRSVMGYREPYDYRQPECFSADDSVPDCRTITPFNYEMSQIAPLEDESMGDTAAVNTNERLVYMPDVNFDFDKRSLNDLGQGKTRQVAQLLREKAGVKVVLQGHADFMGSDQYNEKLGMDRAEAVRQELIALGIPADQLSTVTFGESQPVFAEQTDWARAVNRRVAVQFQE
ncbi:MAG: OmpA family protein [Bdellovibrionota bacterium]|nr:MAG: OmpA family protein [Bdellovibrionota bacterium]